MNLARKLEERMEDAGAAAMRLAAERVLQDAKNNIPTGDPDVDPDPEMSLADSGDIEKDGDGWVVTFDTPYAAKVHENLHLQHPRGGGAKYLERAVTQIAPTLERIVASQVDARLAGGLSSDVTRRR